MRSKRSRDEQGRECPLWMRELKLKRSRMMNYMIKILFVFALFGSVASAVTVDIEPAADADVMSNAPYTADGSRTGLLASGASSQAGKVYMRFVLPGNIESITDIFFTVVLSDRP